MTFDSISLEVSGVGGSLLRKDSTPNNLDSTNAKYPSATDGRRALAPPPPPTNFRGEEGKKGIAFREIVVSEVVVAAAVVGSDEMMSTWCARRWDIQRAGAGSSGPTLPSIAICPLVIKKAFRSQRIISCSFKDSL